MSSLSRRKRFNVEMTYLMSCAKNDLTPFHALSLFARRGHFPWGYGTIHDHNFLSSSMINFRQTFMKKYDSFCLKGGDKF